MVGRVRKHSPFPPTQWSAVGRAGGGDPAAAAAALEVLLSRYRPVLRSYLVQVRGIPIDRADDFLQGFIADKVLARGLIGKADPTRGRFRNLLLKSLNNYVATQYEKQSRRPEIAVDPEDLPEIPVAAKQQDIFDQAWAQQVVRAALDAMRVECLEKARADLWEVFASRIVTPAFEGGPEIPYEELVERFGLESPRQAINLLATAKRMFNRNLQVEVGRYLETTGQVDDEIRELRGILMRTATPGGVDRDRRERERTNS